MIKIYDKYITLSLKKDDYENIQYIQLEKYNIQGNIREKVISSVTSFMLYLNDITDILCIETHEYGNSVYIELSHETVYKINISFTDKDSTYAFIKAITRKQNIDDILS